MKTRRAAEQSAAATKATDGRDADAERAGSAPYGSFSSKLASGYAGVGPAGLEGRAKRVEQSTRQLKGLFVANNNK